MKKAAFVIAGAVATFLAVVYVPRLFGTGFSFHGLDFASAMAKSTWLALAVVFVGGIGTSLTPCVYPLIPITVAIFGAGKSRGRLKGAALSGVYVLGMAVMYTSLGIAAALAGKAFGGVMANPWVMSFVALVFTVFAISMLGAFDLALPTGLQTRLSQVGGEGWAGAFLMGLVSGIVAAPCTGPVLGGVLLWVATTRNVLLGAGLLFTFSIGMGVLFFVLGTFAVSLPKSGPWMDSVKSVFAVVMLVAALYFLQGPFPPLRAVLSAAPWVPWVTGGLAALGVLLGGIHLTFHGGWGVRLLKGAGVVLLVGAVAYRVGGLGVVHLEWLHSEPKAIALATKEHKPLMLDFTATWCGDCKALAKVTYKDPNVKRELSRFVTAEIDVSDDESPEYQRLKTKYRFVGLPNVVFVDSSGKRMPKLTVTGFMKPKPFLERLKQVD